MEGINYRYTANYCFGNIKQPELVDQPLMQVFIMYSIVDI